ncbi:hypothetical protein SDC9_104489 [bioreactor metagenome]|uniref:Uncharacterized protein n=1 Tax=bioreactor metagenome TaxID=1076179 RepID=A0A645AXZ8_9ZZZZ
MLCFDQAVLFNQLIPLLPALSLGYQFLPLYGLLLAHLEKLAHAHQLDLDRWLNHAHFHALLFLSGFLQLVGADAEVLLQLIVERVEVVAREEDVARVLGLADGA